MSGIIRVNSSETIVIALAFYRIHPTTYDTIRFELHDLVVDAKERNQGVGTRLLDELIRQAKQCEAPWLVLQCDPTSTAAHRFLFRYGFTISSFGFCLDQCNTLPSHDGIQVIDVTELPDKENEQLLGAAQETFRQLRPNLSSDLGTFIEQVRHIYHTGPAHLLAAVSNDEKRTVLGLAMYRHSHTIKYDQHIYCDDLITDESKRSAGVGRALVNVMKAKGHRLVLDSGCHRGRAHRFYHREGFHIDQFEFTLSF